MQRLWTQLTIKNKTPWVFTLVSLCLLTGCIGKRSRLTASPDASPEQPTSESRVYEFDFSSSAGFSYPAEDIGFANGEVKLLRSIPGFYEDQFDDADVSEWTGIAYPTATLNSMSEAGGVFSTVITGVTYAFSLASMPVIQNSLTEVTATPVSLTGGLKILGVIARVTGSEYYLGATYSGSHKILHFNGSTFRLINTVVATAMEPTAGVTYHLSFEADGNALKYKVWQDGDVEPSWLVQVSDGALSEGRSGFITAQGEGAFEDFTIEDLDSFGPPIFPEESVALSFPEINLGTSLSSIDSVELSASQPGDSSILFELSTNSGASWLVSNGETWMVNTEGASNASTLEQINSALSELDIRRGTIQLRVYLGKSSSDQSPVLSSLQVGYTVSL